MQFVLLFNYLQFFFHSGACMITLIIFLQSHNITMLSLTQIPTLQLLYLLCFLMCLVLFRMTVAVPYLTGLTVISPFVCF